MTTAYETIRLAPLEPTIKLEASPTIKLDPLAWWATLDAESAAVVDEVWAMTLASIYARYPQATAGQSARVFWRVMRGLGAL